MFAYTIKFKSYQSSHSYSLAPNETDIFYELNGRHFTPNLVNNLGGGAWNVSHPFKSGDVFGAYVRTPIIQPFNISLRNKNDAVSYSLSCLKQVQLLTNTTGITFSLFPTYQNVLEEFTHADNDNLIYVALKQEGKTYQQSFAELIENDRLETAEGYSFKDGVSYLLFIPQVTNGHIIQLVDEPEFVTVSQIARYSEKYPNYEIFEFTSGQDFVCGSAFLAVDDYVSIDGVTYTKNNNGIIDSYSGDARVFPTINPRYYFDTDQGLIDYESYLVGIGGVYKKYTGALTDFEIPINDGTSSFTIEIVTRFAWDHRGIYPSLPEVAESVVMSGQWSVSQREETNYFVTTYTSIPFVLTAAQKYIWRFDDSEL